MKILKKMDRKELPPMNTTAVRLYGKNDLRLETFPLPSIQDGEILARVMSDSLCMSSYKAAKQGAAHKRVPDDVSENPVIIGHEFCGEILEVGSEWQTEYQPGDRFVIQPAMNYQGSLAAPGYSYPYIGGNATHIIIPREVMLTGCLLPYQGDSWYLGSLTEPLSCVVGAFHASYHVKRGSYVHEMGIREHGKMAILGGVGPMGLAAIDCIIHSERRPSLLVVTDIDAGRLARAAELLEPETARKNGVVLHYRDTSRADDAYRDLLNLAPEGYDDVLVFVPVKSVVELADRLLAEDGCLNFFAGPSDPDFCAEFNFFNVHYAGTHVAGNTGGNTEDMRESLDMMRRGLVDPSILVTHVGGLDSVIDTTLRLPEIPGGKKLVYTGLSMPMTAIADFEALGRTDSLFRQLHELTQQTKGLWNGEAERYLLEHGKRL